MKRALIINLILVVLSSITNTSIAQQQTLWGVNSSGGQYRSGSIFKISPDEGHQIVYEFYDELRNVSLSPILLKGSDNKFYSKKYTYGGKYGHGFIYEFDLKTKELKKISDIKNIAKDYNDQIIGPYNNKLWGYKRSDSCYLYSFNIENGENLIEFTLPNNLYNVQISYSNEKIILTSFKYIYSYNIKTKSVRQYETEFSFKGKPTQLNDSTLVLYGTNLNFSGTISILKLNTNSFVTTEIFRFQNNNIDLKFKPTVNKNNTLIGLLTHKLGLFTLNLETKEYNVHNSTDSTLNYTMRQFSTLDSVNYFFTTDYLDGSIYKFNSNTGVINRLHEFNQDSTNIYRPKSPLVPTNRNSFIGNAISRVNRLSPEAVFYELDTTSNEISILNISNNIPELGSSPTYLYSNQFNNLVIKTNTGGKYNLGTLLEYDPTLNSITKIHDFEINPNFDSYSNELFFTAYALTYEYDAKYSDLFLHNINSKELDTVTLPDSLNNFNFIKIQKELDNNIYAFGYNSIYQLGLRKTYYYLKIDTESKKGLIISKISTKDQNLILNHIVGLTLSKNNILYFSTTYQKLSGDYRNMIFSYDLNKNLLNTELDFKIENTNWTRPEKLLIANDGNLYGIVRKSNTYNRIYALFRYNVNSKKFEILVEHEVILGYRPNLINIGNEIYLLFYGSPFKSENSTQEHGLIYKYDYVINELEKIHEFNYEEGGGYLYLTKIGENIPQSLNNQLKITPNPSNGKFTIQFLNDYKTKYIEIFNLDGIKVFEQKYQDTNPIKLDLMLKPGIYIIKFTLDDSDTVVQKIIIQ
ncbi:T9SS type A sorting domain-containing protein [Mangrovivirga sp. M17]|uniref:T9SS type A sorting domain-containing protein n=1 Tax=Mangrovivirga halotolerans TaxID=2993936 RepID=A0ABT3RQ26_9BACT|nr:T9SS type A sorting domain-containing protein [Mangrovivirga halotolerans]MCX2743586.1 T9SS type A sorting domain-containing protein [Mangrovivirga halotolerans]